MEWIIRGCLTSVLWVLLVHGFLIYCSFASASSYEEGRRAFQNHIDELVQRKFRGQVDAPGVPRLLLHGDKTAQGVMVVHGLSDTPVMMEDVARYFFDQGMNVVSIRLSNHGTYDEMLHFVKWEEWVADLDFGFEALTKVCDTPLIAGFSTGGILSIKKAIRDPRVGGLFLFAPVFKVQNPMAWVPYVPEILFFLGKRWTHIKPRPNDEPLLKRLSRWFRGEKWTPELIDYELNRFPTRHRRMSANSVIELFELIRRARKLLQESGRLPIPVWLAQSEYDEMNKPQAALDFYEFLVRTQSPEPRMIFRIPRSEKVMHKHLTQQKFNPSWNRMIASMDEFLAQFRDCHR